VTGTLVIKWGGGTGADPAALCADVASLTREGTRIVLVHGGSDEMTALAGQLGVPLRMLEAPDGVITRHTDAATLDVLMLALAGRVKPGLVSGLGRHGVRALGLTGLDAGVVRGRRKRAVRTVVDGRVTVVRDDHSGRITSVDTALVHELLGLGLVPVLSPPAVDEDGEPVNTNADRMAAAVAAAIGADQLVFLTGAPGLMTGENLVPRYRIPDTLPPWVTGGMTVKLVAAREALAGRVGKVTVADGRADHPLLRVLRDRAGTVLDLE
jgi:acetylglutamate/LysW-gamma-L-alpha-aminoadipate kinase